MSSTTMIINNNQVDEQMVLYSQFYPDVYTQMAQQPGGEEAKTAPSAKPKRRRKKSKIGDAASAEAAMMRKRKLSSEQVRELEMNFGNEHKLESERKDRLACELGLDPRQVAVWFQNRRARWKNKKLEEEYSSLKKNHDGVVLEKCRLESEVLKLKEQLNEAEREIQRLAERAEAININSPSSSLSMEATMEPPFLSEFGVGQDVVYDEFYVPSDGYIQGMEWMNMNLYM